MIVYQRILTRESNFEGTLATLLSVISVLSFSAGENNSFVFISVTGFAEL